MSLIKRNDAFFTPFSTMLDEFLGSALPETRSQKLPALNVKDTPEAYLVEVAAPGLKKEDFKIELENQVLTVSAEQKQEKEEKDSAGRYTRREFSFQSFSRSLTVPANLVNDSQIAASYTDGILKLTLPKKDAEKPKQPVQIAVQ